MRDRQRIGPVAIILALALALLGLGYGAADPRTISSTSSEVRGQLITYGAAPSEFGELWVPETDSTRVPVVVMIHGGFWTRRGGDLFVMSSMSESLFDSGFAVWNIEYGRVGERNGGWPHTFDHVAAAVDHVALLSDTYGLDSDQVAVIGHSAGGHLAIWTGGRSQLLPGDPGADPLVLPSLIIGLAPIRDLDLAARDGLGNNAVVKLLGGEPRDVADRYRVARAGADGDVLVIIGADDDTVPVEYTRGPIERREASLVPTNHLGLINPEGIAMSLVQDILARWQSGGIPRSN